jgi:hypothetical protein
LIDVAALTMMTEDKKLKRKIRMNAIVLGLVALGFFALFIVVTASKT